MSAKTLPEDINSYELYLDDCNSNYQFSKKDRVWRVLRFGQPVASLDRYTCYRYGDYWLTIVENGPQKQIVAAYESEEWPEFSVQRCHFSDHVREQMASRGIEKKDLLQLARNYIVYDRSSKQKYRFTGLVWGDKLNVVVNVPQNVVVTAYWK